MVAGRGLERSLLLRRRRRSEWQHQATRRCRASAGKLGARRKGRGDGLSIRVLEAESGEVVARRRREEVDGIEPPGPAGLELPLDKGPADSFGLSRRRDGDRSEESHAPVPLQSGASDEGTVPDHDSVSAGELIGQARGRKSETSEEPLYACQVATRGRGERCGRLRGHDDSSRMVEAVRQGASAGCNRATADAAGGPLRRRCLPGIARRRETARVRSRSVALGFATPATSSPIHP